MVKAVLCDIDGTIVDSNWLHAAAWRDAFEGADVHLDLEDVRRQIGKGGDELIPVYVPWWRRRIIEDPLKSYRKLIFQMDYLPKVAAFPGVRDLFLKMRAAGIRIALASSAEKDELGVYRSIADVGDLVEENSSGDDVGRSKPHPDVFQVALEKLGLGSSDVLALGDTPYDAEAAGKAGVRTVGVTTGGWSSEELYDAGCIEVYEDLADLLARFDESSLMK